MTRETPTFPPGMRRPSIVQMIQWSTLPMAFMDECAQRFGDIFTVRFAGLGTVVFLTAPADPCARGAGPRARTEVRCRA